MTDDGFEFETFVSVRVATCAELRASGGRIIFSGALNFTKFGFERNRFAKQVRFQQLDVVTVNTV